jgi:MFS family permease
MAAPTIDVATMPPPRVVRAYLAISGLFTLSASVIWGVNTLFLLDAGLDIFEVFVANSAFTVGTVLFEIPTGVVADTAGRRRSFLASAATLMAGTLAYVSISVFGGGLVLFSLASLVLGVGFCFYSGAVEAWLVDALRASGYDGQLDPIFARGSMVSGAAMLVGSVGGGLVGTIDLAWPYVLRAVLLAAAFSVGFRMMHDIGFTPRRTTRAELPAELRAVFHRGLDFGWNQPSVRLLMLVSAFQSAFLMWGFYAWQPYFLELLGRDAVWVTGVVSALIALATIAGNGLVEYLARFCGRRTTLLLGASVTFAAGAIGVGLADAFWPSVVLLLVAIAAMGVATPVQQAYVHEVVPSGERATVVSFVSMVGSAGGIGGPIGLGYLSRVESAAAGYVVGGATTLLALPPVLLLRRRGERADRIVGRRAGKRAPCAAQGLPEVSAIDTTARQPELVT